MNLVFIRSGERKGLEWHPKNQRKQISLWRRRTFHTWSASLGYLPGCSRRWSSRAPPLLDRRARGEEDGRSSARPLALGARTPCPPPHSRLEATFRVTRETPSPEAGIHLRTKIPSRDAPSCPFLAEESACACTCVCSQRGLQDAWAVCVSFFPSPAHVCFVYKHVIVK